MFIIYKRKLKTSLVGSLGTYFTVETVLVFAGLTSQEHLPRSKLRPSEGAAAAVGPGQLDIKVHNQTFQAPGISPVHKLFLRIG